MITKRMEAIVMSTTEAGTGSAFGGLGIPALGPANPAEWWQAQQSIMRSWQNYAYSWSQHRLEDFQSTMDLARAPLHDRDSEQIAEADEMAGWRHRACRLRSAPFRRV